MKRKHYDALGKRLHGVRLITIKAREPRIYVEYKVDGHAGGWQLEEARTMGAALSIANGLIHNFAQARIVWERPQ